ncbi:MAG: molybdopterin-dependent oxidoreductase [Planctomycetota bacterium]|nr:molybdopterin-dependent oxidoreductase [Planctomycetota bacterium]MDG2143825.1 molybdopterin-dependent oxidoreductase [Planctomycetota bacterium]
MSLDAAQHTRGESLFTDDLPEPEGCTFGAVFTSTIAHGKVLALHTDEALAAPGVVRILTAADVPGENQIGAIVPDEPLFAETDVHHEGQPIAMVIATTPEAARAARHLIRVDFKELEPVTCPREAARRGHFIVPSRTLGNANQAKLTDAFKKAHVVVEGTASMGGQEHLYLENQASLAAPLEGGRMRIFAGTQGPTAVQRVAARVLDLPMSAIEVEVKRLGGGFGGKEDQATPWATFAALGALVTGRPVKVALQREEDMISTGKRHPYDADWKIGLDEEGKIVAYEATLFQNAGASADLSPAILERSLFHGTGSYFVPATRITAHSCRTNLVPFTAFRGFGGPQGMFVIESALARAAEVMGRNPEELQAINLLTEGDRFPFGQIADGCHARRGFQEAAERYDLAGQRNSVDAFNTANVRHKRGLGVMPVCFGISFTNTMMNQAGALVHIYTDGSVHVATGAVEMGQGVTAKLRAIAHHVLECDIERITIATTSTTTVANTSPTAASAGADLNGMAVKIACEQLRQRLDDLRAKLDRKTAWPELIATAHAERIHLSCGAHYSTPKLEYNKELESGNPFAYHVFGTAITQATVDCLRGTYTIDSVHIVHDAGRSLAPLIDQGQVEGALAQGIGWLTLEDLQFSDQGRLLSRALATYKAPDIYSSPGDVRVTFLEDADNPTAVLGSKGIGEPPLMYGIGAYFAIRAAARQFRTRANGGDLLQAPLTPERLLMYLHG